ncbi:hypothetical protein FE904_05240 [Chryseobacterium indologenes]|uniref:hypothetical protein n=1 Tax=Chryseobacterium indologenes TaxID=253 RepID=UPI000F50CCEB|nr:hypothetical protein [Chryseobacterium indologenes]TLX27059.1 hypothetical protein FE904_05240 [Chryseobacterium indologenes]
MPRYQLKYYKCHAKGFARQGKTDPSVNTLERITKALEITLVELFASTDEFKEINSLDKSLMEKGALMESPSPEEKQNIYTMLDNFIGKRKKIHFLITTGCKINKANSIELALLLL